MSPNDRKLIAVFGATGQQGGGVVRALQGSGQFRVRALTRDPGKHPGLADEVVAALGKTLKPLKRGLKSGERLYTN